MKICMVLPHFYPYVGGAEKMFHDLAKGLADRGHEVRVIAQDLGADCTGYKELDGIHVWYCNWPALFGHPLPKKSDLEENIKWCDVVHTSTFTPAHIVSVLAHKYHKPSIMTIHEVHGGKWYWVDTFIRATGFYVYEMYCCKQPYDMYHAVSEATKADYHKYCGRGDVRRVYLANEMVPEKAENVDIDLYDYFGIDQNKKVFLFYGRPGQTKGIYVYEKAILELKKRNVDLSDTRFCFVLGSEPANLRARFVKRIKKNGMQEYMLIQPSLDRKRLSKCIMQADYVVVPSITEGFGLSALEACQMGKKLIYSNAGSLPEVVYGQVLGFQNRNEVDLADKLEQVILKKDAAFEQIPEKTFTYDAMIGGIEKLYQELIQKQI
ncbi:MAG: glycosyltransferase family 4 protein [Lachnospiraceae bacterium]|nr:glycosyltransferase family 4 protein [Lachnospiraceae bacterium]